jgi:hypothetical protein
MPPKNSSQGPKPTRGFLVKIGTIQARHDLSYIYALFAQNNF